MPEPPPWLAVLWRKMPRRELLCLPGLRGMFSAPDPASSSPEASREMAWLLWAQVCVCRSSFVLGESEGGAGRGSDVLCFPFGGAIERVDVGDRSFPSGSAANNRCRSSIKVFMVLSRPASATSTKYLKSVTASSKAALRSSSSRLLCSLIVICCSAITAIWSPSSKALPKRLKPRCFSRSMSVGAWSTDSSSRREGGAARFWERLTFIFWMIVPPSR